MAALMLMSGTGYSVVALGRALPAVAAESRDPSVQTPSAVTGLSWPDSGQAAIGSVEDGVLATAGQETSRPIASMTKVITALMVLEKQPFGSSETGQTYTIGQTDVDNYRRHIAQGGSAMGINFGQTLTQYQALQGMLLPSGNNIADSLAVWVFGSMDSYLSFTNSKLAEWGLAGTTVVDASGFSPGSRSTPSEMIVLGQRLMSNPVLARIVAEKEAFIPGTGTILNTNALVQGDEAIGIKTGRTDEAGSCLLFAVKHGPDNAHTLIGVMMGQPTYSGMFASARVLSDSALENFGQVEVLPAGSAVGKLTAVWGKATDVVTARPLSIYGWKGKAYEAEIVLDTPEAPVLKNQVIGQALLSRGNSETSVQLVAQSAIDRPGRMWQLTHW